MQRTLDENSTKDPALFYTVFTSDGEIVASNCPYFDLREEMKLLEVGQGSKKALRYQSPLSKNSEGRPSHQHG
jgi:hypothetical protein